MEVTRDVAVRGSAARPARRQGEVSAMRTERDGGLAGPLQGPAFPRSERERPGPAGRATPQAVRGERAFRRHSQHHRDVWMDRPGRWPDGSRPQDLTVQIRRLADALEKAPDRQARAHLQYLIGLKTERLAAAAGRTAQPAWPGDWPSDGLAEPPDTQAAEPDLEPLGDWAGGAPAGSDQRLSQLLRRGRPMSRRRRRWRWRAAGITTAAAALAVMLGALAGSGPGPSWPASVRQVQAEAAIACRNPNVAAEPSLVNFACAPGTRRILWIFALMTSRDNPAFRDPVTGRVGLEPIAPVQGGELAWSLNLHHPYDPANPVDSIAVAARAINTIIGGATLTSASGRPVIRPGLEADPANCRRYTGSGALTRRPGYPSLCARPVRSAAGQAALVADVFARWVVGAPARAARSAAVLYRYADDPGAAQAQSVLRWLARSRPLGLPAAVIWLARHAGDGTVLSFIAEGGLTSDAAGPQDVAEDDRAGQPRRERDRGRILPRAEDPAAADLAGQRAGRAPGAAAGGRPASRQRRDAPGRDRACGQVLPAAGRDPYASRDGAADLECRQPQWRRPRGVVRGLRQPDARAGSAGGRSAKLGNRRDHLSVAAALLG